MGKFSPETVKTVKLIGVPGSVLPSSKSMTKESHGSFVGIKAYSKEIDGNGPKMLDDTKR